MKKIAAFLILTWAGISNAQLSQYLTKKGYNTVGATQYYVVADGGGNDSADCSKLATPCNTPQAAYLQKPKLVRHPTTINMGCGSYAAGAYVEGDMFNYDPTLGGGYFPDAGWSPSIIFNGTLANITLSGGAVTGTLTSATAGGGSGSSVWGTFTMNQVNGWDAGELAGKWIQITGGTGAGQVRVIKTNDAGTATIDGTWGPLQTGTTTPDSTSTFAIVWPCTTVLDGLADNVNNPMINTGGPYISNSFIVMEPQTGVYGGPQVIFQNMNVATTRGGNGITVYGVGSNVLVQNVLFTNVGDVSSTSASRGFIANYNGGTAISLSNTFKPSVAKPGISTSYAEPPAVHTNTISKFSSYLYSAISTNDPVALGAGEMWSQQNEYESDHNGILFGNAVITSIGDNFLVFGGNGLSLSLAPGGSRIELQGATFNCNSVTGTKAIRQSDWTFSRVGFFDANSSIANCDIAYSFDLFNSEVSAVGGNRLPIPSGSMTADIKFVLLNATHPMTDVTGASPKRLTDTNGNVIDDQ